jgi:hypothetical protein
MSFVLYERLFELLWDNAMKGDYAFDIVRAVVDSLPVAQRE